MTAEDLQLQSTHCHLRGPVPLSLSLLAGLVAFFSSQLLNPVMEKVLPCYDARAHVSLWAYRDAPLLNALPLPISPSTDELDHSAFAEIASPTEAAPVPVAEVAGVPVPAYPVRVCNCNSIDQSTLWGWIQCLSRRIAAGEPHWVSNLARLEFFLNFLAAVAQFFGMRFALLMAFETIQQRGVGKLAKSLTLGSAGALCAAAFLLPALSSLFIAIARIESWFSGAWWL